MTYKFSYQLSRLLKDPRYSHYCIYHYCSTDPAKQANAVYLICAFQVIILNRSASDSWKLFSGLEFTPFRDASVGPCNYQCTILNCLKSLEKAINRGWFSFQNFLIKEYEHYERVENGDLNWIIPQKFLAFSCPSNSSMDCGFKGFTPEDYLEIFKALNVSAVIRLNNKTYDEKRFTDNGINHYDLFFPDGSCPSNEIVTSFLNIANTEKGAIAVHCKAGLGRTGTLIGCYAIKNCKFSAEEFIAWCRICRPGSILGPQQQFLIEFETHFNADQGKIKYSAWDRFKAVYGDRGQAKRLISAKRSFQTPQDQYSHGRNLHRTPLVRAQSINSTSCN